MIALYSTAITRSFSCRIPKKHGNGYLKSCFGWNSNNKASLKWESVRPKEITTGDYCDLDGYLDIELRLYTWDVGFEDGVEAIKESLSHIFPRITRWEECSLEEVFNA